MTLQGSADLCIKMFCFSLCKGVFKKARFVFLRTVIIGRILEVETERKTLPLIQGINKQKKMG